MAEPTDLWQRYCDYLYLNRDLGIAVDISRMRFDDEFFDRMGPRIAAALASMRELEAGAIANRDEGRMVGHYWLRNPDLAPDREISAAIRKAFADLRHFTQGVSQGQVRGTGGPFENVLSIGIGGSALGPQLLADALGQEEDPLALYFLDNTDPDGIDRTLGNIGATLDRTLVIVISKSGTTPETHNAMLETRAAYHRANLQFADHAVAVTMEGSRLDALAEQEHWLARFPIWDWVGGRTAVTSAVGLLPAALQGIKIEDFLAGAAAMDEATRQADVLRNPAALLALMWYYATDGCGRKDMVVLPYKDRLSLFGRYLQQLIMESLGKELDRSGRTVHQGITVYGNKGSTDQHAYVQQLLEGVGNFFVTFIEVLSNQHGHSFEVEQGISTGDYLAGFLHGTRQALYEKGRDSLTITIDEVAPTSVGQLIALYERAVGLYAELIDVNAYHQPGVEAGKRAARAYLDLQTKVLAHLRGAEHPLTAPQIAEALEESDQTTGIYQILERLAADPDSGVSSNGAPDPAKVAFRHRKVWFTEKATFVPGEEHGKHDA